MEDALHERAGRPARSARRLAARRRDSPARSRPSSSSPTSTRFTYLFAKVHRLPVISIDNIQMVDRCRHDAEILRGVRRHYLEARAFVGEKLPRADRYLITTFFHPPIRKKRTTLVPSILRPEILAARSESGAHLLVYGRIGESSTARSARERRTVSSSTGRATASRRTRRTGTCATARSRTTRSSTTCARAAASSPRRASRS